VNYKTLDRVAQFLLSSARDTHDFRFDFKAMYDMPPTAMSQVHYLRSILQAKLANDDAYELSSRRAEFGRVEFTDLDLNSRFLLKSSTAFAIEQQMETAGQLAFFPAPRPTQAADLHVIVFDLGRTELKFAIAPAIEVGRKKQVRVIGQLEPAGCWPLEDTDFDGASPFDQDLRDRFDELGGENEEGSTDL
jgi:hypothetical protein